MLGKDAQAALHKAITRIEPGSVTELEKQSLEFKEPRQLEFQTEEWDGDCTERILVICTGILLSLLLRTELCRCFRQLPMPGKEP